MIVVGIDQSITATAIVIFETDAENKLQLKQIEIIKAPGKGLRRMMEWYRRVRAFFEKNLPGYRGEVFVARELHNQPQVGAANALQELAGFLDLMICYGSPVMSKNLYAMIPVTTWKKFITGKGNLAKDTSYLLKLNESIQKIDFLVKGVGILRDDNAADAICLAATGYAAYLYRENKSLLNQITKMDLAVIEKNCAQMFDYGS